MFELPVTSISESIHNSLTVLLVPDSAGIAVGITLQATIQYM